MNFNSLFIETILFYHKTPLTILISSLVQSAILFFIAKCDNFITTCDRYYKLRRLLQIATGPPLWILCVVTSWLAGAGLETEISENRRAIFGRTGPTGQRGPALEVYNFDRKISTWVEPFHLRLDRNFLKLWRSEITSWFPLHLCYSNRF